MTPSRTLVIAPQWIGDAVMCEPLLAVLAARGARLTVAALPSVAPVFEAMPEVAEIVVLPFAHGRLDLGARWRLARSWRGRFDAAYVLPNSIKAALVPWFAGIACRAGYAGEGRRVLLTKRLSNPRGRPPMVAHYAALAGGEAASPRLRLADASIDAALAAAALRRGGYWAFAPGAEYGPAKRWPAEHVAALAAKLASADGTTILLLGSPAERALCDEIASLVTSSAPSADVRVAAGAVPLRDAIALVAASRGLVSNDSGLMHVAAGFGVPQVAVFGSTSPLHTPPLNPRARVVWLKEELGLACMPCFKRTCRYGHYRCLTSVAPERVEAELGSAVRATA